MRRGGFGREESDQPGPKEVRITPAVKVLHPIPRACIGLAVTGGGVATLFMWDWRYFTAGLMVALGGLIVGPWQDPQEPVEHKEVPGLEGPSSGGRNDR